jgi:hypothetical protein
MAWNITRPQDLEEDARDVWHSLGEDGLLKNILLRAATEGRHDEKNRRELSKMMIYPVVRGLLRVATADDPYPCDGPIRAKIKEVGKSGMKRVLEFGACSVKRFLTMTVFSEHERLQSMFLDNLIPTFVMSTMRKAVVYDLSELLFILARGADSEANEASRRAFVGVRSSALLVIRNIDARNRVFQQEAGGLSWLLGDRARRNLVTVFLAPAARLIDSPRTVSLESDDLCNLAYPRMVRALEDVGLRNTDPIFHKMLGYETHICLMLSGDGGKTFKYIPLKLANSLA